MSDQSVRIVWFAMLLLHGLGHGGAIAALAWIAARPSDSSGAWSAAKSWLLPTMAPGTATLVATGFWAFSAAGFVAAALLYWFGNGAWQPIAIASAIVSTTGIVLFFGTWPLFNTLAALAVNVIVVVALVVMRWTPPTA